MKLQININDDIVKKIDEYAKAIGISRSACCAMWIGNAVLSIEKATESLKNMGIDVSKALEDERLNNDVKSK